jgi:16S rRNA (guanine527-N7)-methyltransferase
MNDTTPTVETLAAELEAVLPGDTPRRAELVALGARHLALVLETNQRMNLTRITDPHEAAVKHVCDSIAVAPLIRRDASLLDVGSGAGFPGIPLAIVLPEARVVLAESVGKRARFLDEAVEALGLANVEVRAERAEDILKRERFDFVLARAAGATLKLLELLRSVRKRYGALLLYKGRRAEAEIAEAAAEAKRQRLEVDIPLRYELVEELGSHCIVRYRRA